MSQVPKITPEIRRLTADDDISELTEFLHRSYAPLAAKGMRFLASHQDDTTTLRRAISGECYLALLQNKLVGTITVRGPHEVKGSPWLSRPDVATFGQFAVALEFQGQGVGSNLLGIAERRAAEWQMAEIALNTAEPAVDLIRFYEKRGYRLIEYAYWDVVNYRSVVLSKRLAI